MPGNGTDCAAWAVPTFESLGLYYNAPFAEGGCRVRYRVASAADWHEGYPLVYDHRERQYRGSLVGLKPGTPYDIRLEAGGRQVDFQARTRSEELPVGKTTHLPAGTTDEPLRITEGGSADGWHLVTPASGAKFISDVFNLADYNVVVEADYVILRGLELKNAGIHGVLIRKGVQHVAVRHRPRLLSDNGPCYLSGELEHDLPPKNGSSCYIRIRGGKMLWQDGSTHLRRSSVS